MNDIGSIGKLLILAGSVLVLLGGAVWLLSGTGIIGRLPGDIRIERSGFTCLFPLASMILLSLILTVVLNVILRMMRK
jgi:hypothetical protein